MKADFVAAWGEEQGTSRGNMGKAEIGFLKAN
jgi:hypothetical protein